MDRKDLKRRITLFLGHYGSGKTNLAVNYAIKLAEEGYPVKIYDLDIVNPYFRTLDGKPLLDKHQIELVASGYANTNVDVPAITPKMYQMLDENLYAVVDVGGDDRGALALGRYREGILKENNYEMFLVINKYRIETRDVASALAIKEEIEKACGIHFTALINNSHLGVETTPETILNSLDYAKSIASATGLEVKYTCVRKDLVPKLDGVLTNILPIELIHYGDWV